MDLWIDGGCRNNGYADAVAATAVVQMLKWGTCQVSKRAFRNQPTSQRAELAAATHALELAIEKQKYLGHHVFMRVTIHTDSKYLHNFETDWYDKWERNGWLNARGEAVANQNLMKEAKRLEGIINQHGQVDWIWVPREENGRADEAVNEKLDAMEDE